MLLSADCVDALVSASDGFGSSSSIFVSGSSFESFLQTPHKQVKVICGKKGKENAMKTILWFAIAASESREMGFFIYWWWFTGTSIVGRWFLLLFLLLLCSVVIIIIVVVVFVRWLLIRIRILATFNTSTIFRQFTLSFQFFSFLSRLQQQQQQQQQTLQWTSEEFPQENAKGTNRRSGTNTLQPFISVNILH